MTRHGTPVLAGVVCGVVGFTSSFAVVLTGLQHVGATPRQAASGLTVLCLTMGLGSALFSWLTRMPITFAWSTPGAALLATTAATGFRTAVGAFVVCGILLALCGLVPWLGRAVQAIPTPLSSAMLAGVLLTICVEPVRALVAQPAQVAPVVLAWVFLMRVARRWAVPGALAVAVLVTALDGGFGRLGTGIGPTLEWVTPRFEVGAAVSIAVPLFLVTMTSQNLAGTAVLASFGYRPRLGPVLGYSGLASAAGALAGGHAINLAAISAALAAGPEAGPDRDRRWVAGLTCGLLYVAFGPMAAFVVAVARAAPAGLIAAVAGLALLATLGSAAATALEGEETRIPAALTFVVAASGIAVLGIGAAFWGLVAGLAVLAVLSAPRARRSAG